MTPEQYADTWMQAINALDWVGSYLVTCLITAGACRILSVAFKPKR